MYIIYLYFKLLIVSNGKIIKAWHPNLMILVFPHLIVPSILLKLHNPFRMKWRATVNYNLGA